jgi:hypothetical protein
MKNFFEDEYQAVHNYAETGEKSPHPPFDKGGQGGICHLEFAKSPPAIWVSSFRGKKRGLKENGVMALWPRSG